MVFSIWTYQRNQIWKDEITLFTDCVQKSPNKARPHISLGIALIRAGRNDEAMIVLSKAVQLNPKSASAHNSYGVALSIGGDFEQAIPHFEEAIRILPIYKEAKHNLDKALAYQEEEKLSHRH
jgi:tetratricopeptide (TPR) repeat protein